MLKAIFLITVALIRGSNQQCGVPAVSPSTAGRIVGGAEARAHSWPWQVAFTSSYGTLICGATIINSHWVLTAAHCCHSTTPSSFRVRVGTHSLSSSSEPNAQILTLNRVVLHPGYTIYPVATNDFCLLRTSSPISFNSHVSPVCLPTSTDGPVGKDCIVTGWGSTEPHSHHQSRTEAVEQGFTGYQPRWTDVLRQVTVCVTDQAQCNAAYSNTITPQMLCAAAPGKDSCQGDSGGPLVCRNSAGVYKIVGVVSWGYGCARPGFPGVYARTFTALDWITSTAV